VLRDNHRRVHEGFELASRTGHESSSVAELGICSPAMR
jgi:hypothetical protein